MPKLSVIIPVYGVEQYIERCARSLFEQSLEDVEFIFIDDYSPDKSITVLESIMGEYQSRFRRMRWTVRLVRLCENTGLPAVRRKGIQLAEGDYLIHCDSDDWMEREMLTMMYSKAVEEDADMVVCDYYLSGKAGCEEVVKACHSTCKEQFMEDLLFQINPWPVWNKLIKRSLYNDAIRYPSKSMGEDLVFCVQLADHSQRIAYVNAPLYHYMFNPSSITNERAEMRVYNKYLQMKENTDLVLAYLDESVSIPRIEDARTFLKYNAISSLGPLIGKRAYYDLWKNAYPGTIRAFLTMSNNSFRRRFLCLMTYLRLYPLKKDRVR